MSQRLFFALWPDEEVRTRLAGLSERVRQQCGGRRTSDDKLHLTLAFLGEVPASRVDELVALTQHLPGLAGAWDLDRLGYFSRGGIVWAGSERLPVALATFRKRLWNALAPLGFTPPRQPFQPHVTLLRKARSPDPAGYPDQLPIAWHYRHVALVHSAVDGPGRRYVTLARTSGPEA